VWGWSGGTDAGSLALLIPRSPANLPAGGEQYGLTQLANLARLPATGAMLIVAPLKLVNGSGSPCRPWPSCSGDPNLELRANLPEAREDRLLRVDVR